jgi:hypothetical protein
MSYDHWKTTEPDLCLSNDETRWEWSQQELEDEFQHNKSIDRALRMSVIDEDDDLPF